MAGSIMMAKVNAWREVRPLLFFGHLPLKGKTPLWSLVCEIFPGYLEAAGSKIKASPKGEVGGVCLVRAAAGTQEISVCLCRVEYPI